MELGSPIPDEEHMGGEEEFTWYDNDDEGEGVVLRGGIWGRS